MKQFFICLLGLNVGLTMFAIPKLQAVPPQTQQTQIQGNYSVIGSTDINRRKSKDREKLLDLTGKWQKKYSPPYNGPKFYGKCNWPNMPNKSIDLIDDKKIDEVNLNQEGSKIILPIYERVNFENFALRTYQAGSVVGNKFQSEIIAAQFVPTIAGIYAIGIKTLIRGIISDNGNTIKGTLTCEVFNTYSGTEEPVGKHDFVWKRIAEKYEVRLRLFIPSPAVKVKAGDVACKFLNNAFCVYGGDNRRFSYNSPSHRYIANAIVTTDSKSSSPLLSKPFRDFCPTKRYLSSQSYQPLGRPSWWLNLKAGAEPVETKKVEVDTIVSNEANSVNAVFVPGKDNTVKVSFKVYGANPFVYVAPGFDADINVFIQDKAGEKLVRVEGTHDGYPAYEVYVNRQLVYGYDPEIEKADLTNLFPPADVIISKKWTQWNLIENSYLEQKIPSCGSNSGGFSEGFSEGFGGGSFGGGGAGGSW